MKLLILNAAHCLAHALVRESCRRTDVELQVEDSMHCSVELLSELAPDAVIVPPLGAPADIEPAIVNAHAEAVEATLDACLACDVPLVWCVSDQMYESGGATAIEETMVPAPRDEALRRLVITGNRIRAHLPRHLIVRIGPLFALEGSDAWLPDLLAKLLSGESIRSAEDVIICPTAAEALAMALLGMLQQQSCGADSWGAYHLAGTEPVSAFTFTSVVRTQLDTRLSGMGESVELADVIALRLHPDYPMRRVLNCRRMLETFGVHQKPWRLELDRLLDQWCRERSEESER
ncbi:sugar nucleotide-binding protein [Phytohalomonas tamaricis]|uniref:sugar nucleotide-binding protein n=1 Tax=Phytohalomonas tamaricis TaxID=2081032 RepID=UPI000D0AC124|nr:sugar nucleotide-binding protein [Phytohalomonas tamaricis]